MKLFLTTAISLVAVISAQAVTYTITASNLSDAVGDQAITDNSGAIAAGSGIAALGFFSSVDPVLATADNLVSDFVILASEDFSSQGPEVSGFFSISTSLQTDTDPNFAAAGSSDLFLFFGNGTTLENSTSIGLIDIEQTVGATTGPGPFGTSVDSSGGNIASPGTVILGSVSTDSVEVFPGIDSAGSFQLVQVPEPSSTLLIGLAGIGMTLRRRR